jgi:hypothetical protein
METIAASILAFKAVLDAIVATLPSVLLVIGIISGTCAQLAAIWKKPDNEGYLQKLNIIVNALAFNIGHAKNSD